MGTLFTWFAAVDMAVVVVEELGRTGRGGFKLLLGIQLFLLFVQIWVFLGAAKGIEHNDNDFMTR